MDDAYSLVSDVETEILFLSVRNAYFIGNYAYPYLEVETIEVPGVGDIPNITKNYVGLNFIPGIDSDNREEVVNLVRTRLGFENMIYISRTEGDFSSYAFQELAEAPPELRREMMVE